MTGLVRRGPGGSRRPGPGHHPACPVPSLDGVPDRPPSLPMQLIGIRPGRPGPDDEIEAVRIGHHGARIPVFEQL